MVFSVHPDFKRRLIEKRRSLCRPPFLVEIRRLKTWAMLCAKYSKHSSRTTSSAEAASESLRANRKNDSTCSVLFGFCRATFGFLWNFKVPSEGYAIRIFPQERCRLIYGPCQVQYSPQLAHPLFDGFLLNSN